jgi:hypothetical protein
MRRSKRFAPVLLLLAVCPALAWAQTSGDTSRNAGVVTTLAGNATVARASLPGPQPLRFKDAVFLRDRISTAERSIVRVLLGGKALVTVRELSALTITENTGRSIIDLSSGKIAMGVLRQRMRPGEVIEIRTPNAIAAIRGTVLVVELIPESGGSDGAPRYTTKVHVLHGLVEVSDPNNPGAPPQQVGTLETWSRTGGEPFSLVPLSPSAAQQVLADLRSRPQFAQGPNEFVSAVTSREQARAVAVAEFLASEAAGAGSGGEGGGSTVPHTWSSSTPNNTDVPIIPTVPLTSPSTTGGTATVTGTSLLSMNGGNVTLNGSSSPVFSNVGGIVDLSSDALRLTGTTLLTLGSAPPIVNLDGTTFRTAGSFVNGDSLTALLAATAPLVNLIGRADLASAGDLVKLSGNSAVVSLGQLAALTTSSITVRSGAVLSLAGSSGMVIAGDLFRLSAGSNLIVANGPLLSLTGNSSLFVTGALVSFGGVGSTLSITNSLCAGGGCTTVGGLPVFLSGGGSFSVSSNGSPVKNLAGNNLSITPGSAVISVSGTAQATVLGH